MSIRLMRNEPLKTPADAPSADVEPLPDVMPQPGRCDESKFQDALSAVDDLQICLNPLDEEKFDPEDHVEATLMEHLEILAEERH